MTRLPAASVRTTVDEAPLLSASALSSCSAVRPLTVTVQHTD